MVRDVDTTSGIRVLQPRTANGAVFFKHRNRAAGLEEAMPSNDATHACPNDDNPERCAITQLRRIPRRRAKVAESCFLQVEVNVRFEFRVGDQPRHDAEQVLVIRHGLRAANHQMFESSNCECPHSSEAFFFIATGGISKHGIAWSQILFQERQIAGCSGKRRENCAGIGLLKCASQCVDTRGHCAPFFLFSLALCDQ